jgi:hypothetical protein
VSAALHAALALAAAAAGPMPIPTPIGVGPRFQLPPAGARAERGLAINGLRCDPAPSARAYGVHVEVFASRRVVLLPPGIGVAAPRRREGAFIKAGRCSYPLRTMDPTGGVEVRPTRPPRLGDLFAVWGQPLGPRRLLSFRAHPGARVQAFLNGRRWTGDPRAIPLRRHSQIVLQVGGFIPPHPAYLFPKGL